MALVQEGARQLILGAYDRAAGGDPDAVSKLVTELESLAFRTIDLIHPRGEERGLLKENLKSVRAATAVLQARVGALELPRPDPLHAAPDPVPGPSPESTSTSPRPTPPPWAG